MKDKRAVERQCLVSREILPKDQLLRFVVDPKGELVVDLSAKLPGRGYWVKASKDTVQAAVDKGLFRKATKGEGQAKPTLVEDIISLWQASLLKQFSLARKAGALIQGFDKVAGAIVHEDVLLLIRAEEASERGAKKLPSFDGEICAYFDRDALATLGYEGNITHLAVLKGGMGEKILHEWRRFAGFIG